MKFDSDEFSELYKKALFKDIKATDELNEIFHTTDMTQEEYISHLKIIARGKNR